MKGRYYDPIGVFLSQDPVEGKIDTPPSLHRYLYAFGNPVRYVDPNGREAIDALQGLAQFSLNLLAGGEISPEEQYSLKQKDPALFNQLVGEGNIYSRNTIERQYSVDLRNLSVTSNLVSGRSVNQKALSVLTLGIPDAGEAAGNLAGAVVVGFDSDVPQSIRNQAHEDIGSGIGPIVAAAVTHKALKTVKAKATTQTGRVVESSRSTATNVVADDSVGAARVRGATVEQQTASKNIVFDHKANRYRDTTTGRFVSREEGAAAQSTVVIGKIEDLPPYKPLKPGETTILDELSTDLGSVKANAKRNASVVRRKVREGADFRDASVVRKNADPDPTLDNPDRTVGQSFLGLERLTLENKGLKIDQKTGLLIPEEQK